MRSKVFLFLIFNALSIMGIPAYSQERTERVKPLRRTTTDLESGRIKIGKLHNLEDLRRQNFKPPAAIQPPLLFEANVGQAAAGFAFVLRSVDFAAGFSRSGITAVVMARPQGDDSDVETLKAHAVQMVFQGANRANVVGDARVKGRVNLIAGNNVSRQFKDIPSFNSVVYNNLYPGVQMVATGTNGRLSYGFLLEPNAALGKIRIGVRGVTGLQLDPSGNLLMQTASGAITQTRPRFVEVGGRNGPRVLQGRFLIHGKNVYGFDVKGRTAGTKLTVDPEIVFSTYFGGASNEGTLEADNGAADLHGQGFDVAIGPQGHAYVVGTTASTDFPVTAAGTLETSTNAFVLRIDPASPPGQQLVYATYIGGTGFERGLAVAPRDDGSVYVTGCTTSQDFPTSAGVLQPTRDRSVGYIVRLTPAGDFDIGTLLGRTVVHHPASIAFSKRADEPEGFVYVAGSIETPAAGVVSEAGAGGFQTEFGGGRNDGFITKINAALTRSEYFTLLGGTGRDLVRDLAVNNGFAFVTGATSSINFPTTEFANQRTHSQASAGADCTDDLGNRQCFDAFVSRVGQNGSTLVYSTFFGGNREEFGRGIAVASNNQATFTGAVKPLSGNNTEIFVARLEGGGENLLWDTRLPGLGRDHGEEVVVDAFDRAHVVGTISKDGLSTSEALFHGGRSDIFYGRFAAATGEKEYFTYIGGTAEDRGFAVAANGDTVDNFCAFAVGSTRSQDIATVAPLEGGEQNKGRADLLMVALCDIIGIPPIFQKTVSQSTVTAGDTVTFTISVLNGGDVPVGVLVTDMVPTSLTVTGVSGSGCGRTGNTVTCAFNASPGTSSIDITVRTSKKPCPSFVTNTATLGIGRQSIDSSASVQVNCEPPSCGNGRIDPGEQCEPSTSTNCRSNCTLMVCGDGIRDPGEECDNGNLSTTGTCNPQCRIRGIDRTDCSGGLVCADNLVCGTACSVARCVGGHVIFGLCLFGDDVQLCTTPRRCMPASEATFTFP